MMFRLVGTVVNGVVNFNLLFNILHNVDLNRTRVYSVKLYSVQHVEWSILNLKA